MSWENLGVEVETERDFLGRATWAALRLILWALSAATTAAFFAEYAAGMFVWLVGADMAGYVAALVGALTLDGGALAWSYLRQKHADSMGQMSIAGVMSVADLAASLSVTVLYLALRGSSLQLGAYTAAGELSDLGRWLHIIGALTVTIGIAANFGAAFAYSHFGAGARRAEQQRKLESLAAAARFAADQRRLELVTRQALQSIFAELPDLAQSAGDAAEQSYLAHTMPTARRASLPASSERQPEPEPDHEREELPARPFPNGNHRGA